MRKLFSFIFLISIFGYTSIASALPVLVSDPASVTGPESLALQINYEYEEEQAAIDAFIGTGQDTYSLAKWMWGIMAGFTGALMFGTFRFITWYEHRKYDREKARKAVPDRTSRFLGDAQATIRIQDEKPQPAPGKRRVISEGQPLFGGK